jgi:hypothetical protein
LQSLLILTLFWAFHEVRMAKASRKSIYCPLIRDVFCGVFYYAPPLDI